LTQDGVFYYKNRTRLILIALINVNMEALLYDELRLSKALPTII